MDTSKKRKSDGIFDAAKDPSPVDNSHKIELAKRLTIDEALSRDEFGDSQELWKLVCEANRPEFTRIHESAGPIESYKKLALMMSHRSHTQYNLPANPDPNISLDNYFATVEFYLRHPDTNHREDLGCFVIPSLGHEVAGMEHWQLWNVESTGLTLRGANPYAVAPEFSARRMKDLLFSCETAKFEDPFDYAIQDAVGNGPFEYCSTLTFVRIRLGRKDNSKTALLIDDLKCSEDLDEENLLHNGTKNLRVGFPLISHTSTGTFSKWFDPHMLTPDGLMYAAMLHRRRCRVEPVIQFKVQLRTTHASIRKIAEQKQLYKPKKVMEDAMGLLRKTPYFEFEIRNFRIALKCVSDMADNPDLAQWLDNRPYLNSDMKHREDLKVVVAGLPWH